MQVLFVAGFGPIVRDTGESRRFYEDALGLTLEGDDEYRHTGSLEGSKHFALWTLDGAAESCFGAPGWPSDIPAPTAWLEFEVSNMDAAVSELESKGYRLLVADRTEPWGQVVTRLLSPEGVLVGVVITPSLHEGMPAS